MALNIQYTFGQSGITWKSGNFYTFRYQGWANDPKPMIILFYRIQGINPDTGHQWRLIQGINLNYIPRSHRRLFVNQWQHHYEVNNGNVRFTYDDMKRRYPWLQHGVRRYLTKPTYYIKSPIEIGFDDIEEAVISTYSKDYSRKVKQELVDKYRRVQDRTKAANKKRSKGLFGGSFKSIFNWKSNR
ncbi:MAG: hypothetical protein KAS32_03480 [Candidatus Peribacteraceae bacterium]|nr:hypothetical protein [Candidatus Peribacteraceae bacterium]